MKTLTASEARSSLYRLIDEASINHQPVVITGKRHSAVLVAAEDWASPDMRKKMPKNLQLRD